MNNLASKCIEVILKNEGGFQNNPNDTGNYVNGILVGTKYGIAAKYFPNEDIPNLTIERAKEIYFKKYWKPLKLEEVISNETCLQIFDMAVNAGKSRAVKLAQKLVGVPADGKMGPITRNAINIYSPNFTEAYKLKRKEYYTRLSDRKPSYKVFLKGWLRRVDHTKFKI